MVYFAVIGTFVCNADSVYMGLFNMSMWQASRVRYVSNQFFWPNIVLFFISV
jgi:hypothetical protein